MAKKKLVTKIVSFSVIGVISVALIVGNVIAFQNQDVITSTLSGTGEDFSQAAQSLKNGDELCEQIAEDSIVLLRNENKALPLKSDVTKLNVFGYGATDRGFIMNGVGSGSSTINEEKKITLMDALTGVVRDFDLSEDTTKEAFAQTLVKYEVNPDIKAIYDGFNNKNARPLASSITFATNGAQAYWLDEPAQNLFTPQVMESAAAYSDVALFVVSRDGGENIGEQPLSQRVGGKTDNSRTYLELTSQEEGMLKLLDQYFGTTVVILNTTNTMHLGFLEDETLGVDACLYIGLPGQSGARAIPGILSGKINPSGRYTDIVTRSAAVAKSFDPTFNNFAATNNQVHYVEDIYHGYKWFETADEEGYFEGKSSSYDEVVVYPFGHGLSYTTFKKEISKITYRNDNRTVTLRDGDSIDSIPVNAEITVEVKVANTGDVAGKEVVELYYTPEYHSGGIEKAYVNLLGFAKTGLIDPDDSHTVEIKFTKYDMASYDATDANKNDNKGYELEKGKYEIKLMENSHTEIEKVTFNLGSTLNIVNDPVTGTKVQNRFVDDGAYAGLSTTGEEAGVSQKWLSREDFVSTFPTGKSAGYTDGSKVTAAANYVNDAAYANVDKTFQENQEAEMYFWTANGAKASKSQLTGKGGDSALTRNYELMKTLSDFEADEWKDMLDQMNVQEMKVLIEQGGFVRQGTVSVGMRELYDYDGPAGFNANSRNSSSETNWTAYASEALIGCCWNESLLFLMGRAMGSEANDTTIHGWYAPGVNLHRSNYNARNFEYYSEDGVLSGKLAVQVIAGAKTNGLTCYLKHFACSEEGPNPRDVNTWITEQNLRENFLRPFEIAVKGVDVDISSRDADGKVTEAKTVHIGANGMMTAFNRVGASWAGAHYSLNVSVLREEWGFKGTVITDWTSGTAALGGMRVEQGIRCGNDLWLDPNNTNRSLDVNDPIDRYCARLCAKNILYTVADTMTTYNEVNTAIQEHGAQLDKYQTTLSDAFKNVTSWWQPVLITFDTLVAVGFVIWALFLTLPMKEIIAGWFGKNKGENSAE